jgi:pumilio family protein 6
MDIVRGHVKDLVLKHDASRIIQTLVKRGTAKEREEIAGELKGQYKALAQSRYSKVWRCIAIQEIRLM